MNKSPYIVAIEIGSSKIKGAVGQIDPTGMLTVKGIEEEHQHPNYVRYGCVQNVKEVANSLNLVITKLNNRISPSKISAVYLGVGGRSLKSSTARLTQHLADDTEVTPEMVEALLSRAAVTDPGTEKLEVEAVEYQVDGKSQGIDPVGMLARDLSATVSVVSCRSQILRNLQLSVSEKLNLSINGYVVRPMALADLVLTNEEKRLGVMLVDCGAETTTVAIYKEGVLVYLATIPLGSRHITRDLMTLPAIEERAEEIKRTIGDAHPDENHHGGTPDEIDTSKINNIVSARAAEIAANVAAQTGYANPRLLPSDLTGGVVIVGGGSMLKGFAEKLSHETGMNVRRGALPASVRMVGSRVATTEDLDVVALLYRLSLREALKPCTVEPAVTPPAPQPVIGEPDDFEEPEEELPKESIKERITRIFRSLGGTNEIDSFDDEEINTENNSKL